MDEGNRVDFRFFQSFRLNGFEIIEYSYTAMPAHLGIMFWGNKGPFLEQAIQLTQKWKKWDYWQRMVRELVDSTTPSFLTLKVDLKNNEMLGTTVYGRYLDGITYHAFSNLLPNEILQKWASLISDVNSQIMEHAAIAGIRNNKNGEPSISVYYDVRNLSMKQFQDMLAKLVPSLSIPNDTASWFMKTITQIGPSLVPQVIGIDLPSGALKLDIAKVNIQDFLFFLRSQCTSHVRQEELRMTARQLGKSSLDYLGLKGTDIGQREWKAYFTLSQRFSR